MGRNGCCVAGIKEQTEEEKKRIIQEGSEWCSFSDMAGKGEGDGKGRRRLLKESLEIVVVITSSVIIVQRIQLEKKYLFVCLFSWRYNPLWLYFSQPDSGL